MVIGNHPEHRIDGSAHIECDVASFHMQVAHTRNVLQCRGRLTEGRFDGQRRKMAHLGKRSQLHQLSRTQDPDAVTECLEFLEDV